MKIYLKIIFICIILLLLQLVIPSISANTIYKTGFEDGVVLDIYNNDWMETTIKKINTGDLNYVTNTFSYSGEKCYIYSGHSYFEFNWDFSLGDYAFKKFETMIYFGEGIEGTRYNHWTFYDKSGLKFIKFDIQKPVSSSDVIVYAQTSAGREEIGVTMKDLWVKFGFEMLSNNSVYYYLGDHSIYAKPFNKVPTEFPYLVRFVDAHSSGSIKNTVYLDNLTIYTNHKPTANPGGPYLGYIDNPVSFDGSDSSDLDGNISEYSWDFGDGTKAKVTSPNPDHTYTSSGTYTVSLTVTDDQDATNTATTTIIVTDQSCPTCPEKKCGDGSSPGFEIIFVIAAIGLILFIYKKRRI